MSQNKPPMSVDAFQTSFKIGKKIHNHLAASCNISFFKRDSMSSRFSARSDIGSVRRGSEASRRTNGRPEMYTMSRTTSEAYLDIIRIDKQTDRFFTSRKPNNMRGIGNIRSTPQDR